MSSIASEACEFVRNTGWYDRVGRKKRKKKAAATQDRSRSHVVDGDVVVFSRGFFPSATADATHGRTWTARTPATVAFDKFDERTEIKDCLSSAGNSSSRSGRLDTQDDYGGRPAAVFALADQPPQHGQCGAHPSRGRYFPSFGPFRRKLLSQPPSPEKPCRLFLDLNLFWCQPQCGVVSVHPDTLTTKQTAASSLGFPDSIDLCLHVHVEDWACQSIKVATELQSVWQRPATTNFSVFLLVSHSKIECKHITVNLHCGGIVI